MENKIVLKLEKYEEILNNIETLKKLLKEKEEKWKNKTDIRCVNLLENIKKLEEEVLILRQNKEIVYIVTQYVTGTVKIDIKGGNEYLSKFINIKHKNEIEMLQKVIKDAKNFHNDKIKEYKDIINHLEIKLEIERNKSWFDKLLNR